MQPPTPRSEEMRHQGREQDRIKRVAWIDRHRLVSIGFPDPNPLSVIHHKRRLFKIGIGQCISGERPHDLVDFVFVVRDKHPTDEQAMRAWKSKSIEVYAV